MAEVVERFPHPTVAYAYLEVRSKDAREAVAMRDELRETHPEYFGGEETLTPEQVAEELGGGTWVDEKPPAVTFDEIAAKKAALMKGSK